MMRGNDHARKTAPNEIAGPMKQPVITRDDMSQDANPEVPPVLSIFGRTHAPCKT